MRKEEFLDRLGYLLQDIPDPDRAEALDYYRDCLEEAGEKEEEAVSRLGSPERIAAMIRADLAGNLKDGGSYTESGYQDERFRDPNLELARRLDLPEETVREAAGERQGRESSTGAETGPAEAGRREAAPQPKKRGGRIKTLLILAVVLVASPLILGAVAVALSIAAGILAAGAAVVVTVFVLAAAALIAGVALGVLGVTFLFSKPLDGLFLIGIALAGLGCGILGVVLLGVVLWLLVMAASAALRMFGRLFGFLNRGGKGERA